MRWNESVISLLSLFVEVSLSQMTHLTQISCVMGDNYLMSLILGQWTSDMEVESLDLDTSKQCSLFMNVTRNFPIFPSGQTYRCQQLISTWTRVWSESPWKLLSIWRLCSPALTQAPPGSLHSSLELPKPAPALLHKWLCYNHKNITMLFLSFKLTSHSAFWLKS